MYKANIINEATSCHDNYNYETCNKATKIIRKHSNHLKEVEMSPSERMIKILAKASSMFHSSETYRAKGKNKMANAFENSANKKLDAAVEIYNSLGDLERRELHHTIIEALENRSFLQRKGKKKPAKAVPEEEIKRRELSEIENELQKCVLEKASLVQNADKNEAYIRNIQSKSVNRIKQLEKFEKDLQECVETRDSERLKYQENIESLNAERKTMEEEFKHWISKSNDAQRSLESCEETVTTMKVKHNNEKSLIAGELDACARQNKVVEGQLRNIRNENKLYKKSQEDMKSLFERNVVLEERVKQLEEGLQACIETVDESNMIEKEFSRKISEKDNEIINLESLLDKETRNSLEVIEKLKRENIKLRNNIEVEREGLEAYRNSMNEKLDMFLGEIQKITPRKRELQEIVNRTFP